MAKEPRLTTMCGLDQLGIIPGIQFHERAVKYPWNKEWER
jgi:hypothetical protein